MRLLILVFALVFGLGVAGAEAGSRITCQCKARKQTWIMGTHACEYHYHKRFRSTLGGGSKPARYCTSKEHEAFRAKLCAEECAKTR